MRICHISWEYPPETYGGLGRHVLALTRAQAALGHEVTVITQHPEGTPDRETIGGVRVVRTPRTTPPVRRDVAGLMEWTAALDSDLADAAEASHIRAPDIVHAHDWVVERAARAASHRWGRPVVVTVHATEAGRHAGWIVGEVSESVHAAEWRLARSARAVITCSRSMAAEVRALHDLPPERVFTVPNGIDLDEWLQRTGGDSESRWDVALGPHASGARTEPGPLILFVGRLQWEKGVQILIEAAALLPHLASARFVIAGTGTQERRFRDLASADDRISFVGHVPDREIRDLYAAADVVVLPSLYEPFGIAALEAAAAGAPLIVSAVGGLSEVVADGVTGRAVPPNDARALAAAVSATVSNPEAARERADTLRRQLPKRYSWQWIARETVAVYERAFRLPDPSPDLAAMGPSQPSGRLLDSGW